MRYVLATLVGAIIGGYLNSAYNHPRYQPLAGFMCNTIGWEAVIVREPPGETMCFNPDEAVMGSDLLAQMMDRLEQRMRETSNAQRD